MYIRFMKGDYEDRRLLTTGGAPGGDGGGGGGGGGGGDGGDGGDDGSDFDLAGTLAKPKAKAKLMEWINRELLKPVQENLRIAEGKLNKYKIKKEDGTEAEIAPEEAVEAYTFFKNKGDLEAQVRRAQHEAEQRYKDQIKVLTDQASEAKASLTQETKARQGLLVATTLDRGLKDTGIKPEKAHLHSLYLSKFLHVHVENGVEKIIVKDSEGNIKYGTSGLMSVEEFIIDYRDKNKLADDWQPIGRAGSGTPAGGAGGRGSGGRSIDPNLPPQERLRIARMGQVTSSAGRR